MTIDVLHFFRHLIHFIIYFLRKEDLHSIQSPFAFEIYSGILQHKKNNKNGLSDTEIERKSLIKSQRKIFIKDFGAGSHYTKSPERKVGHVAKFSSSPLKYALLYQYLCKTTPAEIVLELGTNLGLTTSYLSQVTKGTLYTFEGSLELLSIAMNHLSSHQKIEFLDGNIREKLPELSQQLKVVDFALMDADHSYNATINYFNHILPLIHSDSIVVVSDIYWSNEMDAVWNELKFHPKVTMTMDFFECGILFFRPFHYKNHYVLNY